MARSSSGSGHRPLKAKITGSNPVRATLNGSFSSLLVFVKNMKRFEKHIFICENKRPDGHPRGCCADKGSLNLRRTFKARLKELNLSASIRANGAACLDACEFGNAIVIYPEQIWYGNVLEEDVEEIITEHIIGNTHVERLKIRDKRFNKDVK